MTIDRRDFLITAAAGSAALAMPAAITATAAAEPEAQRSMGPLLGHVDTEQAIVWFRAIAPGAVELRIEEADGRAPRKFVAEALAAHDLCVTWTVPGLQTAREYRASVVESAATGPLAAPSCTIRTPPPNDTPARVSLALGSCASSTKFFDIWDRIATVGADALVLLGDTPYIDKTDLAANRKAHREFLQIPNLAELIRTRPLWATWDDHDFGGNDTDGKVKNKHLIRQAYCEYRAQTAFGDGQHGVYTKFRYGPMEIFLLDPRYFAQTEPSPVAADKPTCLGKRQWEWLLSGLEQSTATFKVLACGMIWDDKKNKEKDDWETYAHEREALFDFIGAKKISGVLLLGGDIHVSRHLHYPTKARLGYDLHQCIVSPLHERIIKDLNVPHPALVWGEPIPNVFLQLIADTKQSPPSLTATWFNIEGQELHKLALTSKDLGA